jgi:glycerophosphoryl diester phosphodiesterase
MRIIGHRGARGYEPENTLRSISTAIDMGVDMVEFDIQLSKEGQPVILHDGTVDRTTNGMGRACDLTVAQLSRFDAGKGERIPLLPDAIDLIDHRIPMNIELKAIGSWAPVAYELQERLRRGWSAQEFLVSSFDLHEIVRFHRAQPDVPVAFLYDKPAHYLVSAFLSGASSVNPERRSLVDRRMVERAKSFGFAVNVYTVNHDKDFARMRALDVDGIFTDYPDRAIRCLR